MNQQWYITVSYFSRTLCHYPELSWLIRVGVDTSMLQFHIKLPSIVMWNETLKITIPQWSCFLITSILFRTIIRLSIVYALGNLILAGSSMADMFSLDIQKLVNYFSLNKYIWKLFYWSRPYRIFFYTRLKFEFSVDSSLSWVYHSYPLAQVV